MYIFGAIALFINGKRNNYVRRILRLSSNEITSKDNEKAKLTNRLNSWLRQNNINIEIEELIIILSIIISLLLILGIFTVPNIIIPLLGSILLVFSSFIFINIKKKRGNIKKEMQLEQFLLDFKGITLPVCFLTALRTLYLVLN